MDFLLVLIELLSLGVTAEALRANIGSKSASLRWHCISADKGTMDNTITFLKRFIEYMCYRNNLCTCIWSCKSSLTDYYVHQRRYVIPGVCLTLSLSVCLSAC